MNIYNNKNYDISKLLFKKNKHTNVLVDICAKILYIDFTYKIN